MFDANQGNISWGTTTAQGAMNSGSPSTYTFVPADIVTNNFFIQSAIQQSGVGLNVSAQNVFGQSATVLYPGINAISFIPFPRFKPRDFSYQITNFSQNTNVELTWQNFDASTWDFWLVTRTNIAANNLLSADWQTLPQATNFIVPPGDGTNTLFMWVMDTNGSETNYNDIPLTENLVLDTTAPDAQNIDRLFPDQFGEMTATFNGVPSDNGGVGVTRWIISNNLGNFITNAIGQTNHTFTGLSNNQVHQFKVSFLDAFDHQSTWSTPTNRSTLALMPAITSIFPTEKPSTNTNFGYTLSLAPADSTYGEALYSFDFLSNFTPNGSLPSNALGTNLAWYVQETNGGGTTEYYLHFVVTNKDGYYHPTLNYSAVGPYWIRFNVPQLPIHFTPSERVILADGNQIVSHISGEMTNTVADVPGALLTNGLQFRLTLVDGEAINLEGTSLNKNDTRTLLTSSGRLQFAFSATQPGTRKFRVTFPEIPTLNWEFEYRIFPNLEISVDSAIPFNSFANLNNNEPFTFYFQLDEGDEVGIRIYDRFGNSVAELPSQFYPSGYNEQMWDEYHPRLPAGVYYAVIQGQGWQTIRKLVAVRK